MRPLALVFLIAGCDARPALIVPEEDTDVPVCVMTSHSEALDCDEYGFLHWQIPQRTVFTVWRCDVDETCSALTPVVDASRMAEIICYDTGEFGEYWRVDYITAD